MRHLESSTLDQRVRADLIAQFNRARLRVEYFDTKERRWLKVLGFFALGGGLFLATLAGITAEYGQPVRESSEAPAITHEAPAPSSWKIYDGD